MVSRSALTPSRSSVSEMMKAGARSELSDDVAVLIAARRAVTVRHVFHGIREADTTHLPDGRVGAELPVELRAEEATALPGLRDEPFALKDVQHRDSDRA